MPAVNGNEDCDSSSNDGGQPCRHTKHSEHEQQSSKGNQRQQAGRPHAPGGRQNLLKHSPEPRKFELKFDKYTDRRTRADSSSRPFVSRFFRQTNARNTLLRGGDSVKCYLEKSFALTKQRMFGKTLLIL